MLTPYKKLLLTTEVLFLLEKEYNISPKSANGILTVVLNNWLSDLAKGQSHLQVSDVAARVFELTTQYGSKHV